MHDIVGVRTEPLTPTCVLEISAVKRTRAAGVTPPL